MSILWIKLSSTVREHNGPLCINTTILLSSCCGCVCRLSNTVEKRFPTFFVLWRSKQSFVCSQPLVKRLEWWPVRFYFNTIREWKFIQSCKSRTQKTLEHTSTVQWNILNSRLLSSFWWGFWLYPFVHKWAGSGHWCSQWVTKPLGKTSSSEFTMF